MYVEPSSRDEQQMTASILAGDTERYRDLIRSCDQGIYRVFLSFMKDPADAEVVAQESFLITTGTVKVRLHGARIIMQKQLASQLEDAIPGKRWFAMILECKHVWDYISGYLDDSLSPETKESVQRHLEHCEICSAILDSTRNILILTADDRIFELPVGFSERLHVRLAQEIDGSSREPGRD
jgi:hypothetical protein